MKTRVYIAGYNLYFGCLKHTPYKWLDLRRLIEILIVRSGQPNATLADAHPIKYITAEINPKAAVDTNSLNDQRVYLNTHDTFNIYTKLQFTNLYALDTFYIYEYKLKKANGYKPLKPF